MCSHRARSIAARLVPHQISTREEEAPRNYSSGGTRAAAAPAERSSRCDSTAQAQRAKIDSVDENDDDDEITTLRQAVQHQEEDLRMAALIGQKLLDTQEELSAELEVGRRTYSSSQNGWATRKERTPWCGPLESVQGFRKGVPLRLRLVPPCDFGLLNLELTTSLANDVILYVLRISPGVTVSSSRAVSELV